MADKLTPSERQGVVEKIVDTLRPLPKEQQQRVLEKLRETYEPRGGQPVASPEALHELKTRFGPTAIPNVLPHNLTVAQVQDAIKDKQRQLDLLAVGLKRDYSDRALLEATKAMVFGEHGTWHEHADVLRRQFDGVSLDDAVLTMIRRVEALNVRTENAELTIEETVPFLAGLLQWDRASRPHFALAPDFFHALVSTDFADKADETPMHFPFHAFTMAFPKSPVLGNASRLFVYRLSRMVDPNHVELTWPMWRVTLYPEGEPIFSQWDDGISRGDFAGGDPQLDRLPKRGLARTLDDRERGFMRPARALVANVLQYIEAKGPLPMKSPERRAPPAPLERAHPKRFTFDVGRTVKLDSNIRRALLSTGGAGVRWQLAQRFIVRGHWRNQVYGEGRALRRRQWIEPFYKGPADVEAAIQRTYEVGVAPMSKCANAAELYLGVKKDKL